MPEGQGRSEGLHMFTKFQTPVDSPNFFTNISNFKHGQHLVSTLHLHLCHTTFHLVGTAWTDCLLSPVTFTILIKTEITTLLHRLNNPVSVAPRCYWYVADRDWIELSRLSIDRSQFGSAKITVDFTHIFAIFQLITSLIQIYLLTLSQINSKNYHFHSFSCAQTDEVESVWSYAISLSAGKKWTWSTLYLIWLEVRR